MYWTQRAKPYLAMAALAVLILLWPQYGCLEPGGPVCANGIYCPEGQLCQNDTCRPRDEVLSCMGKSEGEHCEASGFIGLCRDSLCVKIDCGNGYVEDEELCDDGNNIPGDGCSADCQMQCGDGLLDSEREICDTVPPDGETCLAQGYDMGALGCDVSCERVDTNPCESFSWEPVGTGARSDWQIAAVWAFSSQDIYAAGATGEVGYELLSCSNCGYLFHYDGANGGEWQKIRPPSDIPGGLTSIWAAGPEDIFIGGAGAQMWHFDGQEWTRMESGLRGAAIFYYDMWGSSKDNVFALYRDVTARQSGIIHFDGVSWNKMQISPDMSVKGIWGRDPDNVYVASNEGIFFYDGNPEKIWVSDSLPWRLNGIAGNDTEIIAVGDEGRIVRMNTGTAGFWQEMESNVTEELTRVWSGAGLDALAVGRSGTILRKSPADDWVPMNSGVDSHLTDLYGFGAADILAVGSHGTVLHCCGWESLDLSWELVDHFGHGAYLSALEVIDDECLYAVGWPGAIQYHELGSRAEAEPMESGSSERLWDVWGVSCGDGVYAVGENGTILQYSDRVWTPMESGTTAILQGVWGNRADNVYAVGEQGTFLHWDGRGWNMIDVPPKLQNVDLVDVWGADDNTIFMISRFEYLIRYERDPLSGLSDWSIMTQKSWPSELYRLWGTDECNVWVAGMSLMHYRCGSPGVPASWEIVEAPNYDIGELRSVWGTSRTDVLASGADGALHHFDGTTWSPIRTPARDAINSVAGTSDGRMLYITEIRDRIYRLEREDSP